MRQQTLGFEDNNEGLPLYGHSVSAGFPSPADDYLEGHLNLDDFLVSHPAATFFARASGDSMVGRGIHDGDLLVIDRAEPAGDGSVVVAAVNGELTCKVLDLKGRRLAAANPDYPAIALNDELSAIIEGTVIHSIRHHKVIKYVKKPR